MKPTLIIIKVFSNLNPKKKREIRNGTLMATLIGNPLVKALIVLFFVSVATATGDAPFIIAHKKESLTRLKSGSERVSVSIDIYNQGFSGALLSHSFELEAKKQGRFYGAPAVITFRIPTKAALQEAYSTAILPLDVLAERPPEKKFEWALPYLFQE
ncbi:BRO1 domain-containing protein BROX-like protein isoform 1 [Hibiscus syriacus]|uniref:BRO1 domain-containing protein BROX-like protein isoform 1 n=1 Tax=Hibiscus syriacus TaxID=106335 RepID=A0A6A3C293_HIBSY|nr:BRO1 domain-containing protein BROX-like protein isoform 1 [Hibiscus syriacus]